MATKPSYFANYLPKLILEGHSAESAKNLLREAGLSFSDAKFHRTFAETQYLLQRREITETIPLNRKIQESEIGTAVRPRARGYLANVELAIWEPGINQVTYHVWGARSSKPMSPAWYIQNAIDSWIQSQQGGRGTPEGTPVGGIFSNAVQFVGPDEATALE